MALSIMINKWRNEEHFEEEKEGPLEFSQVEFELLTKYSHGSVRQVKNLHNQLILPLLFLSGNAMHYQTLIESFRLDKTLKVIKPN